MLSPGGWDEPRLVPQGCGEGSLQVAGPGTASCQVRSGPRHPTKQGLDMPSPTYPCPECKFCQVHRPAPPSVCSEHIPGPPGLEPLTHRAKGHERRARVCSPPHLLTQWASCCPLTTSSRSEPKPSTNRSLPSPSGSFPFYDSVSQARSQLVLTQNVRARRGSGTP